MFAQDENLLAVHPCFRTNASHRVYGRIHLPVAKSCNIRCHYCVPAFDCPNESRPGVTSKIIPPAEALSRVQIVLDKIPSVKVIGIAGPGEPLCNPETFETMALIRNVYPHIALCISTNGLLLPEKLEELTRLRVRFLTITVNAVDAEVGSEIYAWILWKGKRLQGQAGARLLIAKQWQGVEEAAKMGFFIKVNSVMIPGVNTREIPKVARRAKEVNVHIHNIMPLIPIKGTKFANIPSPSGKERRQLQSLCGECIPQMTHCRQCRADAVGIPGEDRRLTFFSEAEARRHFDGAKEDRLSIKVAVASKHEGVIDLHFGHAREFKIYQVTTDGGCIFVETRGVNPYCHGAAECGDDKDTLEGIKKLLSDCHSLFCVRIGLEPERRLKEAGIEVITTYDRIEEAVRMWFLKEGGGDRDKKRRGEDVL